MELKRENDPLPKERASRGAEGLRAAERRKQRCKELEKSGKIFMSYDVRATGMYAAGGQQTPPDRGKKPPQLGRDLEEALKKENLHLKSLLEHERRLREQLSCDNADLKKKLRLEVKGSGALKREASEMQRDLRMVEEDRKKLLKLLNESNDTIAALREENQALRQQNPPRMEGDVKVDQEQEYFWGHHAGLKHGERKLAEKTDCKRESAWLLKEELMKERAARDAESWRVTERGEVDKLKKIQTSKAEKSSHLQRDLEEALTKVILHLQSCLVPDRYHGDPLSCKVTELKGKLEGGVRGHGATDDAVKKENLHLKSLLGKERRLSEQLGCDVAELKKKLESEVKGHNATRETLKKENWHLKSLLERIRRLSHQLNCNAAAKVESAIRQHSILKRDTAEVQRDLPLVDEDLFKHFAQVAEKKHMLRQKKHVWFQEEVKVVRI